MFRVSPTIFFLKFFEKVLDLGLTQKIESGSETLVVLIIALH
jgi:hypothetical protein